jgi:hypothetical protein
LEKKGYLKLIFRRSRNSDIIAGSPFWLFHVKKDKIVLALVWGILADFWVHMK